MEMRIPTHSETRILTHSEMRIRTHSETENVNPHTFRNANPHTFANANPHTFGNANPKKFGNAHPHRRRARAHGPARPPYKCISPCGVHWTHAYPHARARPCTSARRAATSTTSTSPYLRSRDAPRFAFCRTGVPIRECTCRMAAHTGMRMRAAREHVHVLVDREVVRVRVGEADGPREPRQPLHGLRAHSDMHMPARAKNISALARRIWLRILAHTRMHIGMRAHTRKHIGMRARLHLHALHRQREPPQRLRVVGRRRVPRAAR